MLINNKVAIYVRVSTTSQAEEGYSIEEQTDKLKAYCEIKDWTIFNIYIDGGFSGSNTERPALEQLISDAKRKMFDTVLVYKLDRLSRSQKDTLFLIEDIFLKNNVDFLSLQENFDTSTPFGKAMIGLLSVFAQLEREQIKERMQLGKLGRAKAGKTMMWAKPSFGYSYDKSKSELIIDQAKAIIIREIYTSYLAGRSITKLRDDLNIKYPKKPSWNYRIIRGILSNPVYYGANQYMGNIFEGTHEPIISKEVFDKTQLELKERQIKAYEFNKNPRPFRAKYMLSGIAKCGYCGTPLKVTLGTIRKDGTRNIRYQCINRFPRKTKGVTVYNNGLKCDSGFYELKDVEDTVLTQIRLLQVNSSRLDDMFNKYPNIDLKSIKKQVTSLDKKLKKMNDLYLNDLIDIDELKTKTSNIINEKKLLEKELENNPIIELKEHKKKFQKYLSMKNVLTLDYESQKNIVNHLIRKVIVSDTEIKIEWKI